MESLLCVCWDGISISVINNLVCSFRHRCALCLYHKGESLNGHFHEELQIPSSQNIDNIFPSTEEEYNEMIIPKFTKEEKKKYDSKEQMKQNGPVWNSSNDERLKKFIFSMGLSCQEAANRLGTRNVDAVRKRLREICFPSSYFSE